MAEAAYGWGFWLCPLNSKNYHSILTSFPLLSFSTAPLFFFAAQFFAGLSSTKYIPPKWRLQTFARNEMRCCCILFLHILVSPSIFIFVKKPGKTRCLLRPYSGLNLHIYIWYLSFNIWSKSLFLESCPLNPFPSCSVTCL